MRAYFQARCCWGQMHSASQTPSSSRDICASFSVAMADGWGSSRREGPGDVFLTIVTVSRATFRAAQWVASNNNWNYGEGGQALQEHSLNPRCIAGRFRKKQLGAACSARRQCILSA